MNKKGALLQILISSGTYLFITRDEYVRALLEVLPASSENEECPRYEKVVSDSLLDIKSVANVPVTTEYSSPELETGTLAYYRIKGLVTSDSPWFFSTRQFEKELLSAEANPAISCHFIHISSGGGEAWYLDRLSETMRSLGKPIYVLIDKTCGSAAYYIACHGKVVKCLTQNDTVGCIGTMVCFWDISPYLESLGFRKIEEYATISDLKNKKFNDLLTGKPEQYIREELDPLAEQFRGEVRDSRAALAALPLDHPVLRGETYSGMNAISAGLTDGLVVMTDAFQEAYALGKDYTDKHRNKILSFI